MPHNVLSQENSQEPVQLNYQGGYWTGTDGEVHIAMAHVVFMRHARAWLQARGYEWALTTELAGWRAEAMKACRQLSYWQTVTDSDVKRSSRPDEGY